MRHTCWKPVCARQNAVHLLRLSTPGRPGMEKCKKRKISEENRTFNDAWADSFAFTSDESGLPVSCICGEKEIGKGVIFDRIVYWLLKGGSWSFFQMAIFKAINGILAACCFPSFSSSSSCPSHSLGPGRLDVPEAHYCPHGLQIEVWIAQISRQIFNATRNISK